MLQTVMFGTAQALRKKNAMFFVFPLTRFCTSEKWRPTMPGDFGGSRQVYCHVKHKGT